MHDGSCSFMYWGVHPVDTRAMPAPWTCSLSRSCTAFACPSCPVAQSYLMLAASRDTGREMLQETQVESEHTIRSKTAQKLTFGYRVREPILQPELLSFFDIEDPKSIPLRCKMLVVQYKEPLEHAIGQEKDTALAGA
ncbi:hypothetical protein PMIN04_007128 [Paraphaeosphaeria minitans]